MKPIQFGTSGWRALYHTDFTWANIDRVLQAIAEEASRSPRAAAGVAVGYDVRFMGRSFAERACEILAGNGLRAVLPPRDIPTPVLSHLIVSRKLAGGVNFTASHNPAEYNGIKYSPESGGPALPETTRRIEARIAELGEADVRGLSLADARARGLVEDVDPRHDYFAALDALVQHKVFSRLRGRRIAVDCKYAVARGYLDDYLSERGVGVLSLHATADPYFGGEHPEPAAGHVDALQAFVREHGDVVLGLACDGDADRFGIVDGDGTFVEANVVLAVLLDYLVTSRGWTGAVARSVATTHLIDAVARHHGLLVHETPVGFKYIGDLLTRGEIVFGGEESAGLTIQGHLPEKDGILACVLVAEMVSATGRSVGDLVADLFQRVGAVHDRRAGLKLTPDMTAAFASRIDAPPAEIAGRKVLKIDRTDGTKLLLDSGEWVLLRKSGTEPLVRLYAESTQPARLDPLLQACAAWLGAA